jgi:hypothetical protein
MPQRQSLYLASSCNGREIIPMEPPLSEEAFADWIARPNLTLRPASKVPASLGLHKSSEPIYALGNDNEPYALSAPGSATPLHKSDAAFYALASKTPTLSPGGSYTFGGFQYPYLPDPQTTAAREQSLLAGNFVTPTVQYVYGVEPRPILYGWHGLEDPFSEDPRAPAPSLSRTPDIPMAPGHSTATTSDQHRNGRQVMITMNGLPHLRQLTRRPIYTIGIMGIFTIGITTTNSNMGCPLPTKSILRLV